MSSRLVTARKRNLGQGKVFTPVCHSVYMGDPLPRQTPGQTPPKQTPPSEQTPPGRYPLGRQPPLGRHPLGRHLQADTP